MDGNKSVSATFTLSTTSTGAATKDDLISISGPKSIEVGKTYDVTVTYDATTNRDITVDLKQYLGNWTTFSSQKVSVPAGIKQKVIVPVTVPTNTLVGQQLTYVAYITPTGQGYDARKDLVSQNNIYAKSGITSTNYTLTTNKAGTGSGTISGNATTYTSGATATLTATPATGSTFTGWSGACTGTGSCVVTMNANKTVTATFALVDGGTGATSDVIRFTSGPNPIQQYASHKVSVSYDAKQDREIYIEAWLKVDDIKLAGKKVLAPAGTNKTVSASLYIGSEAQPNEEIIYYVYMVPIGGDWGDKLDEDEEGGIYLATTSTFNPTQSFLSSNSSTIVDLELGMTHPFVVTLQEYLNANGYVVNLIQGQPGSVGYESDYFGEKTKQALIKYQKAKGITPAQGYFGAKTRSMMGI
jgi:hypothetical protein